MYKRQAVGFGSEGFFGHNSVELVGNIDKIIMAGVQLFEMCIRDRLYADDGASEIVKEFKSGTLSLGIEDVYKRQPLFYPVRRCTHHERLNGLS